MTCFSDDLYLKLRALADARCTGNDMDLVRSASRRDPGLGARARTCLRPEMPKTWRSNPNTWLSNRDLDAVMHQYSEAHPGFEYMGTLPSDFMSRKSEGECVSRFCDTRWASKKLMYGAIVNLDTHTQSGSHWVGLVLDCRVSCRPVAYYYDSLGGTWPRALDLFFESCKKQFKGRALQHFLTASEFNTNVHQRGNTECGMHALQFMDAMVHGVSFRDYCAAEHNDTQAFEKRMVFFSK